MCGAYGSKCNGRCPLWATKVGAASSMAARGTRCRRWRRERGMGCEETGGRRQLVRCTWGAWEWEEIPGGRPSASESRGQINGCRPNEGAAVDPSASSVVSAAGSNTGVQETTRRHVRPLGSNPHPSHPRHRRDRSRRRFHRSTGCSPGNPPRASPRWWCRTTR